MKKQRFSEAALRKAIRVVAAERTKHPKDFEPDRAQRAVLDKGQRETEALVSAALNAAGLDHKGFEALQRKRDADLARMVAQHKADALRQAEKHKKALRSNAWVHGTGPRDFGADGYPFQVLLLRKPFLIWSIPLQDISDSAYVANHEYSWAKFKFATSRRRGAQKFAFYYYWRNRSTQTAVINARTQLLANGYLKAHAPWTFGANSSFVQAYTNLNLWLGWPTDVLSVQHARELVGATSALGSTLTGGSTRGTSISMAVPVLETNLFAVPPGDIVVFEVALLLEYENDSGDIEADFESGAFQILCKGLEVSLLNAPVA
jgi:hypothetical protein